MPLLSRGALLLALLMIAGAAASAPNTKSRREAPGRRLEESDDIDTWFDQIDLDHDGMMNSTELMDEMFREGASTNMTADELETVQIDMDQDGNGFISLDEFRQFLVRQDAEVNAAKKPARKSFIIWGSVAGGLCLVIFCLKAGSSRSSFSSSSSYPSHTPTVAVYTVPARIVGPALAAPAFPLPAFGVAAGGTPGAPREPTIGLGVDAGIQPGWVVLSLADLAADVALEGTTSDGEKKLPGLTTSSES